MGKPISNQNRIGIEEAARMVGMTPDSFRQCMIQDKFPFSVGVAFKKPGATNYTYYAYRAKVEALVKYWGLCD